MESTNGHELNSDTGTKSIRHRSPAYPAIPLQKALQRAKEFYRHQREHSAPVSAALELWGFKAKSGNGLVTLSALKQFGFMSESKSGTSRQVQLTDLALRIIRDEREPSVEREDLIKKAALSPKIYAETWDKWGAGLAADATMRFFLLHEKKYNEASIPDLIADYKDTIQFAKLIDAATLLDMEGGENELERAHSSSESPAPNPLPPPPKGAILMEGERELTSGILSKTARFRLFVSGEIGMKEIERLIAKLEIDKDILADSNNNKEQRSEESSPATPLLSP